MIYLGEWQHLGGVGVAVLKFGKEAKTSVRRRRSGQEELPFLQKMQKNNFNSGYPRVRFSRSTGETSSLADPNTRGCEPQDTWLDLRVPLERDAVGNYCFAEGNWRVSISGRLKKQPAEEPMEVS